MTEQLPKLVLVAHHRETCGGLLPGLLEHFGHVLRVHPLDGEPLPPLSLTRGAVVLGSHHGVHDHLEGLKLERQWMEHVLGGGLPVLGICFGAQLLGQIAGATIQRGRVPERGIGQVVPCRDQDVLKETMCVMQWHQDGVFELPAGVRRIAAGGVDYPEQVFQVGSGTGVQFHPETTADMLARWLRCSDALHLDPRECEAMFSDLEAMAPMRQWLAGLLEQLFARS